MKIFLTCFVILMVMFGSWINDAAAQQVPTVTPVRDRTPQVRDAIVAAAGVAADQVTEAHLAAITQLDLKLKRINTLKVGDFDGLNNLKELLLYGNQLSGLPLRIFDGLTQLTGLWLQNNQLSGLPSFDNLTQLTRLELQGNRLFYLPSFHNLTQLEILNLSRNRFSTLPDGIFRNLTQLKWLYLDDNQFSTLPDGIFRNLTQLKWLFLDGNQFSTLPDGIFRNLTQLIFLSVDGNQLSTLPDGIFDNLTKLTWLGLNSNQFSTLPDGIFDNLTQRMALSLNSNQLSTLPSGIFKNMTQLTTLYLSGNQLSALPDGIFAGLTELIILWLDGNAVDPLPLPVSLEAVGNGTFKAVAPTGAPFDIVLPLVVSNGSLTTGATTVTIHKGRVESEVLTVNRTPGTSGAVTVNIGVLPGIPTDTDPVYNFRHHQGYALIKSGTLPLVIISGIVDPPPPIVDPPPPTNNPPVFIEGTSTTRTIAEHTLAGVNIGSAVSATDADGDPLTYTLSGTDAAAFRIVSATGQLRTQAALDYETKSVYTVIITASDGSLTDTISVTITVTDVVEGPSNRAPVFTEGASTTRTIAENTVAGVDIGHAVSATDADGDTLTYTLSGTDAAAFRIDNTTGQLRTWTALDYETKSVYTVIITASDGSLTNTISVTITVTDVVEGPSNRAPVFTEGASTTRTIAENTAAGVNIGHAVSATDADDDPLTYTLSGTDAAAFRIVSTTGQLRTWTALDYETKSVYTVIITASDGSLTGTITVTITVTDIDEWVPNRAPVFTEGASTTRTIAENTAAGVNIGRAVSATDADGDTLTYTLSGTDAAAFRIDNTTGQLRTWTALNAAIKSVYSVTVAVSDGKIATVSDGVYTVTITVTINVTDVEMPPVLDVNNDGVVDIIDLVLVATSFGATVGPTTIPNPADVNDDGVVDLTDLLLVIGGMGSTAGVAAAPVLSEANLHHWIVEAKREALGDATFERGIAVLEQLLDAVRPVPKETLLLSNYPNPFNPETWIPYRLANPSNVSIIIYNMRGNVIRRLELGHQQAGYYTSRSRAAHWDGRNSVGEPVASGVYFYTFTTGEFTATRKMLIRK